MNIPSQLTLLRFALVPAFMLFTIMDHLYTRLLALAIFVVASLTDLYDGYLARKYNAVTDFGRMMDLLADKFLVSAAFICFVGMRELHVASWMVVLIVGRELLVTGLRMLAASKGEVLGADSQGKFKTAVQIMVVITILVVLCVNSFLKNMMHIRPYDLLKSYSGWPHVAGEVLFWGPYWLVFVSMLVTLSSGVNYLYKNRHLYSKDVGLKL